MGQWVSGSVLASGWLGQGFVVAEKWLLTCGACGLGFYGWPFGVHSACSASNLGGRIGRIAIPNHPS